LNGSSLRYYKEHAETLRTVDRLIIEYHSLDLGRRVAERLASHGLNIVLDEKRYEEGMWLGPRCGFGRLFAKRQTGSVSTRPASAMARA
jgi:hypothetical protein